MKRDFSRLLERQFDLLVCGGGIYGAWTAWDAALRGLQVAIVEQHDWAGATSSASSKLIHGGLRYLETFDLRLVKKALAERQRLLQTAPHRVWPLRFGVPVFADSRIGMLRLQAGLALYDSLAGRRKGMAHHRFNRQDFAARFPALETATLKGGYSYTDAQTDDARMVLELIDGAIAAGAVCVNYCRMTNLLEADGQAYGARVQDQVAGTAAEIPARQIVHAGGRWLVESGQDSNVCRLTKGVHLVLPAVLHDEALLLTAGSDGRVFFMLPWYGRTLVGTTDTDYRGSLEPVAVEAADVAYLLDAANRYLRDKWSEHDIIGAYAGLRVLKAGDATAPSSASRDWELRTAGNGVHHSIGGKLTSAREDACVIVDAVCAKLGVRVPCATRDKSLPWAPQQDYPAWFAAASAEATGLGIDPESARWLIRRHGKRVDAIFGNIRDASRLATRIVPALPLIHADLHWCAGNEMVVHLDDLLRRRLPLLILERIAESELRSLGETVAGLLDWDAARLQLELQRDAMTRVSMPSRDSSLTHDPA